MSPTAFIKLGVHTKGDDRVHELTPPVTIPEPLLFPFQQLRELRSRAGALKERELKNLPGASATVLPCPHSSGGKTEGREESECPKSHRRQQAGVQGIRGSAPRDHILLLIQRGLAQ